MNKTTAKRVNILSVKLVRESSILFEKEVSAHLKMRMNY